MKARGWPRAILVLVALTLVAACVLPDELSTLQKDVADVKQQLKQVDRQQNELAVKLDELTGNSANDGGDGVTREQLADSQLRLEQLSRQMSVVTQRMGEVDQRLDRYSQNLQLTRERVRLGGPPTGAEGSSGRQPLPVLPPGPDSTTPSSRPTGGQGFPDPEALYNTAYADFSKGNYALAVSGFKEYQQRFPDSALADNALYWIAECHFSQGGYAAAVDALDDLLDRYPDSDKAAAANLKKALAFQEQNQIGQAIIQYRYVVSAFPGSDEARLAGDKLTGLGTSPTSRY